MIIVVAWLLLLVLRPIQAEEPFSTRNVGHIITIALIVGLSRTLVQLPQGCSRLQDQHEGRLSHTGTTVFLGPSRRGHPSTSW
jgi:hypothetical protein